GVLDRSRLVEMLALDPLGHQRTRRDRRAASERLEFRVLDDAVGTDLDLQLHYVATGRRADEPRSHTGFILVERSDVARVLVMVDHLVAVSHGDLLYPYVHIVSGNEELKRSVSGPLDRLDV